MAGRFVLRVQFQYGTGCGAGSSYRGHGSFITICRPSEWYKALAVRDICEESCNSRTVQLSSPTSPYAPPVVLQTFSRRIEKSSFGGGVNCLRLDYHTPMTCVKLPFQNLAMSARSKGSALILSICPFSPGLFTTMPFGSINAILLAEPEYRLKQLFSGRQAYLEVLRQKTCGRVFLHS